MVNATYLPLFTPVKTRYPLYRRLGGPQGRSGRLRKISSLPGFDRRTVRPVASRYIECDLSSVSDNMEVKRSLYRPGKALGLQEFQAPRISRQSAYKSGKVVSHTHWPPLPPRRYSWYSCLFFINPSDRTMALGSTQPLTERSKRKGKAVPLQAWSGPEGSRKLRFPDFVTTAQDGGKVSPTHRPPLPQEILLVLISVRG